MRNKNKGYLTNADLLIVIALAALIAWSMLGCLWPGIDVIPDPPPPPDPIPLEEDTVCTTYDPITQPEFVTGYMIADGASTTGQRVIVVWSHSDTLEAGEDVGASLKNLLEEVYPQYTHSVWVSPTDDRYIFFITDGTNDRNILFGKCYIRYAGARYQFGVQMQKLAPIGMNCDQFGELIVKYPSFNYISWYGSPCDSLEEHNQAGKAIDADHCKGGRDWMDFRHNNYPMSDSMENLAEVAGWGFVGENIGFIDLSGRSVSDEEVFYWMNKGYCVKVE